MCVVYDFFRILRQYPLKLVKYWPTYRCLNIHIQSVLLDFVLLMLAKNEANITKGVQPVIYVFASI